MQKDPERRGRCPRVCKWAVHDNIYLDCRSCQGTQDSSEYHQKLYRKRLPAKLRGHRYYNV